MESRFICHLFVSLDYASVIWHIGSVHAWEPRIKVTFGIDGCMRHIRVTGIIELLL